MDYNLSKHTPSPTRPIKCTVVFICAIQRKQVYSGLLLRPALCGIIQSRAMCPLSIQSNQPLAQGISGSVCYQHYRGMDLDGALQEDLHAANQ
jgi:hypothetical protein